MVNCLTENVHVPRSFSIVQCFAWVCAKKNNVVVHDLLIQYNHTCGTWTQHMTFRTLGMVRHYTNHDHIIRSPRINCVIRSARTVCGKKRDSLTLTWNRKKSMNPFTGGSPFR